MLIGAASATSKGSDYAALDASAGPFTCRRSYHGEGENFPLFPVSNAAIDFDTSTNKTRYVSVLSFKPDVVAMASGDLDDEVNAFLASVPAAHKMILSIWHEADGKVRQKKFTVAQFKAAFIRFCTLVHQANRPNLSTALILEAYQDPTKTKGTQFADMWPGRGFADLLLVDGYTDLGSGGAVWNPAITFAFSVGVPWGIAEIGTRSGAVSPAWMAIQYGYAQMYDARLLCWFNTATGGVVPTPGSGADALQASKTLCALNQEDPNEFIPWRTVHAY